MLAMHFTQKHIKGAQAWDIRSFGFSWFLHHKVFMGRWFGGKNINLLFLFLRELNRIKFLTRMLSIRVRNWCVCSACTSVPYAYAQHAHQFRRRMLSMVWRDLFQICNFYWGYKERLFEKWENWCVCWAYASVPDAYAQHAHQFLTRMLSVRIKAGAYT